jgi:vacuolar-type H+-ATPase subunit I/STV1
VFMKRLSYKTGKRIAICSLLFGFFPVIFSLIFSFVAGVSGNNNIQALSSVLPFFTWFTLPVALVAYVLGRIMSESDPPDLPPEKKQTQLQKEMKQLMWLVVLIGVTILSRYI